MPDIFGNPNAEDRRIDAQIEARRMMFGRQYSGPMPQYEPGLQEDQTPFMLVGGGGPQTAARMGKLSVMAGKNAARRTMGVLSGSAHMNVVNDVEMELMKRLGHLPPEIARKMYKTLQPRIVGEALRTMPSKGQMLGQVAKAAGKDAMTILKMPVKEGMAWGKALQEKGAWHPLMELGVAAAKLRQRQGIDESPFPTPERRPQYPPWEKVGPPSASTPRSYPGRPAPR